MPPTGPGGALPRAPGYRSVPARQGGRGPASHAQGAAGVEHAGRCLQGNDRGGPDPCRTGSDPGVVQQRRTWQVRGRPSRRQASASLWVHAGAGHRAACHPHDTGFYQHQTRAGVPARRPGQPLVCRARSRHVYSQDLGQTPCRPSVPAFLQAFRAPAGSGRFFYPGYRRTCGCDRSSFAGYGAAPG
ncbi:hypothetical protein D3C81_1388050 [compost metagenome]